MKLLCWNVNGIRAAGRGGFLDWFKEQDADIVGVQEIKAFPGQIEPALRSPEGRLAFWHPAKKPGYSGVAAFTRIEPVNVIYGIGNSDIDDEGRVLQLEFKDFVHITSYFPNSQRDAARLGFKLEFCAEMLKLLEGYRAQGKHVVLCGDFNISHRAIDLKNPKQNEGNAGFLPEERAWMDELIDRKGYIDTFRSREPGPGHYTWWSYRPGIRERNIGWRLDYHVVNPEFGDRVANAAIQPHIKGSDHCPVELWLRD